MKNVLKNNKIYFWSLGLIFVLAILLRLDLCIFNRSFWFDEAALAINVLDKGFFDLFKELSYYQSAPPMFLFETKMLVEIFPLSEFTFRTIPFLVSILTLPVFYIFSKYFLYSRPARLLAAFLFAINTNLIFYSTEFKPYALDVFAAITLPLLILRFKLKSPVFLGFIFALFTWYSYASGIMAFAYSILLLAFVIKNKKELKNFLLFILPQFLNVFLFALHLGAIDNTRFFMTKIWAHGYILKDFSNFLDLFFENIYYIFQPFKMPFGAQAFIFGLICLLGAIFIFKSNKIKFWLLSMPYFILLLLACIGSYPYQDRLTLFLTPMFLIFFSKFFDYFSKKSISLVVLGLIFIFSLYPSYCAQKVMKNLPSQDRAMFLELKENYKKGDVIILNETSLPQYLYYSRVYGFLASDVKVEKMYKNSYDYLIFLNSLDKNKNYWFAQSSVKFPNTEDVRPVIEFFGKDREKFIRYNKGKTDLFYVGK